MRTTIAATAAALTVGSMLAFAPAEVAPQRNRRIASWREASFRVAHHARFTSPVPLRSSSAIGGGSYSCTNFPSRMMTIGVPVSRARARAASAASSAIAGICRMNSLRDLDGTGGFAVMDLPPTV
jgi:hypothetical protein